MINKEILSGLLIDYKNNFKDKRWPDEKFKWEAIKQFQDSWDINAPDFRGMLVKSLSKCANLLASAHYFPNRVIIEFAEKEPETVRSMFMNLYDESIEVYERFEYFKEKSDELLDKYWKGQSNKSHFQTLVALTTYLWLLYPDKYYIYKLSESRATSKYLESSYTFKKGAYKDNVKNCFDLYDEVCHELNKDEELKNILKKCLDDSCYQDLSLNTLTIDFGHYLYQIDKALHKDDEELPKEPPKDILKNQHVHVQESLFKISDTSNKYTIEDFLNEVYMPESKYDRMVAVLKKKKNVILQGPPGVGKTFAAKRLAYSIIGKKDENRIEFIQFHQSYSYEDFMLGYKPKDDGFELKYGIFYEFCKKASKNKDEDYFFIIDEINRGNMSKIFGELLMLIEPDYRDKTIKLGYDGQSFSVPNNLHIIGMMNTADRSLALIDYALRRRFSFFTMEPGFDSEGFKKYQKALNNTTFDQLIECIKDLNKEISNDDSLGSGFCIGHSYFCNIKTCTNDELLDIVDFDILPVLNEYWFDEPNKVERWENILHGAFE